MNRFQTFAEFLATTGAQIPVASFILNLLLAAFLSFLLSKIYLRYGSSLSNRRMFGSNFILITMTTMVIISIVKSSLALSLGLVGALSIVRFRAAIKEPEELSYLFLAIAIGLGLGANQPIITLVAFAIITAIIVFKSRFSRTNSNQNLYITTHSHNPHKAGIEDIVKTLQKHSTGLDLRRFDETTEFSEACFLVEFRDFKQLNDAKHALQELDPSLKISFMDNKGIM